MADGDKNKIQNDKRPMEKGAASKVTPDQPTPPKPTTNKGKGFEAAIPRSLTEIALSVR